MDTQGRYQVDNGKDLYRTFPTKRQALRFALTYARLRNDVTWVCDVMAHKGTFNVWRYSQTADRMVPQKTLKF